MSSLLTILMLVILFACVAMCYAEGMWSNAVRLINVVTAALLAMNFFEPVARWLDGWQPSYTYLWDFLSPVGAVRRVHGGLPRADRPAFSQVKVRFLKLADRIGSGVLVAVDRLGDGLFHDDDAAHGPAGDELPVRGFSARGADVLRFGARPAMAGVHAEGCRRGRFACSDRNGVFDPNAEFMPKYATPPRRTSKSTSAGQTALRGREDDVTVMIASVMHLQSTSAMRPSVPDVHITDPQDAELAAYRAVAGQAVVGLIFGLLAPLALVDPLLWAVPALGVLLSGWALRRIRRSEPALAGRKMALAGLVLSLLFAGRGAHRLARLPLAGPQRGPAVLRSVVPLPHRRRAAEGPSIDPAAAGPPTAGRPAVGRLPQRRRSCGRDWKTT